MLYSLKELIEHANSVEVEINGKWVPARPERATGLLGLRFKLRAVWAVLTGRADAFTWPSGQ